MSNAVTPEQRKTFQRDGVVKLPGVIDGALLDELNRCFDRSVSDPTARAFGNAEGDEFSFVDYDNRANRSMYEQMLERSPFGRIAAGLWESAFVGFLCEELFWKKGKAEATRWHQDTSFLPWAGAHWANFWIPLVSHTARYGIRVVRGSHKGIMYDGTTFTGDDPTEPLWGENGNFPRLPDITAELAADPTSWDVVSFDVEPGDLVVLHPHCLHAGGAADENMPERRTLVLRFFGDESYYSGHLPDAPGLYENAPIKSVNGSYLQDGDPYRPAGVTNLNA